MEKSTLIIPENIYNCKEYYDNKDVVTRTVAEFKEYYKLDVIRVFVNRPAECYIKSPSSRLPEIQRDQIFLPMYSEDYTACFVKKDRSLHNPVDTNIRISTLENSIHVMHHKDDDPSIVLAMVMDNMDNFKFIKKLQSKQSKELAILEQELHELKQALNN